LCCFHAQGGAFVMQTDDPTVLVDRGRLDKDRQKAIGNGSI